MSFTILKDILYLQTEVSRYALSETTTGILRAP
jgi:hypothetical protein